VTFWNIDKNQSLVADIALLMKETDCDILVLAETGGARVDLDTVLQQTVNSRVRHLTPLGNVVHVWTTLTRSEIRKASSKDRFEAFRVQTVAPEPTLMVFAHLRSKVGRATAGEVLDTEKFAADVRAIEKRSWSVGRTIVAGDLNLWPYDDAMLLPEVLGASASRTVVAGQPTKRRNGSVFNRFYNPTWNLLGDAGGPPGTYYWEDDPHGGNWYCLDQVLLRAPLIPTFLLSSLQVVTAINGRTLIAPNGRPQPRWSDHLPITFALET
jgi:hypothetical protein